MDPYMSVLFMLTISFPEAMLASYLAIQFMGVRPRLIEVVLVGLIQAVVAFIVRSLPIPVGLHTIILVISISVLIHLISRMPFLSSAIGVIIVIIINILEEVVVVQIMTAATGLSLDIVVNDPYLRLLFFAPVACSMMATIVLFKRYNITFIKIIKWQAFKEKYLAGSDLKDGNLYKEYLPAVIFIFLPIFLLFILNFAYISVKIDVYSGYYPDLFKILFNALIIVLAFVSVWTLRRISKSIEKELEAKKAAETIEQLKELILSIRKQRHDFNHHMQVVHGLMETGSYEKARDYIQKTYHYISGTGELIKTDNPAISALLYTKIVIAETRNILFDIRIDCSLEEFPLNSNEASSLLGNLIDNAIHAVNNNEPGSRVVRLEITAERGEYYIEVANRGEIDPILAEKIFKANFTTKEGHAGLGLTIVKEMVEKYKGIINVTCESVETVFRVKIPFWR